VDPDLLKETTVLSLTGIASPATFEEHVRSLTNGIKAVNFADHHKLTLKDYNKVTEMFAEIDNSKKIILTTEKDAVKMMNDETFPSALKKYIYYIPMNIKLLKDEESFNNLIINYVTKNRSYMRLS
jgi:tetraacyldisaccharide 4'-kinase